MTTKNARSYIHMSPKIATSKKNQKEFNKINTEGKMKKNKSVFSIPQLQDAYNSKLLIKGR
jgi:hypothetical protein